MGTTTVGRDHAFETAFLTETIELAQRVENVNAPGFPGAVFERLEKGEAEYHDGWAGRDWRELIAEALQEGPDMVGWGILFLQRVKGELPEGEWQDLRMICHRAAAHAAAADSAFRELQRVAGELLDAA